MFWNRCYPRRAGRKGATEEEGVERSASTLDSELIHSLHQWLDLCREAESRGDGWAPPLSHVLEILRKLLDAQIGVVQAYGSGATLFYISTGNPICDNQLSTNEDFARVCHQLFSAPHAFLVGDALPGREFADPLLRSKFPNLSLLTAAWSMPGAVILFAFFSPEPGHFNLDHRVLVDYFGCSSIAA